MDRAKLTPRERILRTLLECYVDVVEGWRTEGAGDGGMRAPLAVSAWNHPSYRELERTRIRMRDEQPELYWHLAERYVRPESRVALRCPRCLAVEDWPKPGHKPRSHRHSGGRVELQRASVLVVSEAVRPELVVFGLRWVALKFRGDPFVPDDLERERVA